MFRSRIFGLVTSHSKYRPVDTQVFIVEASESKKPVVVVEYLYLVAQNGYVVYRTHYRFGIYRSTVNTWYIRVLQDLADGLQVVGYVLKLRRDEVLATCYS